MELLEIKTGGHQEFLEITDAVHEKVEARGWENGVLFIYVPHTTAAIFINENADPDVTGDIQSFCERMAPEDFPYRHGEGNSPGHIKSVLFHNSTYLFVEEGDLKLGTWQGIFFAEFDGPRERKVYLKFITAV